MGVIGFFVAIVSSISGGGGGMIITPAMILLGFPTANALASLKGAGLGLSIGAITRFTKEKEIIDWRWAKGLSAVAIAASFLVTQLVLKLTNSS